MLPFKASLLPSPALHGRARRLSPAAHFLGYLPLPQLIAFSNALRCYYGPGENPPQKPNPKQPLRHHQMAGYHCLSHFFIFFFFFLILMIRMNQDISSSGAALESSNPASVTPRWPGAGDTSSLPPPPRGGDWLLQPHP